MKYADVKVGQRVLYSYTRASSPKFRVTKSLMAEVLDTGVYHRYEVTTGGWSGNREYRETNSGIRLRVYRHDRRPVTQSGGEQAAEYETVTIAAHLVAAEGDSLAAWQAARKRDAEHQAATAEREAAEQRIIERFADAGYDVTTTAGGNYVVSPDDALSILEKLRALEATS